MKAIYVLMSVQQIIIFLIMKQKNGINAMKDVDNVV